MAHRGDWRMRKKILGMILGLFFFVLWTNGGTGIEGVTEGDRPLTLITNDDGIDSPGLKALALEMTKLGRVVVVAPKNDMSGSSHSQNSRGPSFYGKKPDFHGLEAYWVDNTPVTCVRWALATRLDGLIPDLVISGINDGPNFGMGIYYSGTVGGAREGALAGAIGIAVSLLDLGENVDYEGAARVVRKLAKIALRQGKKPLLWNVNFPYGKIDDTCKTVVARLSTLRLETRYSDREDPKGNRYFWFRTMINFQAKEKDSDYVALLNGAVTVTPLLLDPTDFEMMDRVSRALSESQKNLKGSKKEGH